MPIQRSPVLAALALTWVKVSLVRLDDSQKAVGGEALTLTVDVVPEAVSARVSPGDKLNALYVALISEGSFFKYRVVLPFVLAWLLPCHRLSPLNDKTMTIKNTPALKISRVIL